jgi:hypothetical protein
LSVNTPAIREAGVDEGTRDGAGRYGHAPMRNVLINALLAFDNQNLTVARANILE